MKEWNWKFKTASKRLATLERIDSQKNARRLAVVMRYVTQYNKE
jgi:hypothetical protein